MYKLLFLLFGIANAMNSTIIKNNIEHTEVGFGKCVAFRNNFLIVGGSEGSESFSVGLNKVDIQTWSPQFSISSVPGWCSEGNVIFNKNNVIFYNKNTLMLRSLIGSFFQTIKTLQFHEIIDVSLFNNIIVIVNKKIDGHTWADIISFKENFISETTITELQSINLNQFHKSTCLTGEYLLLGSIGGNGFVNVYKFNTNRIFEQVDVILPPPGVDTFGEKLYCEDNGLYISSDESTKIHSFTLWPSGWVSNGFVEGFERGNKIIISTNNNNIAIGDADTGLVNIYRRVGSYFTLSRVFESGSPISSISLLQESTTLVLGKEEELAVEIYEWFDDEFSTCPSYTYDFGEKNTIVVASITSAVMLTIYAIYYFTV